MINEKTASYLVKCSVAPWLLGAGKLLGNVAAWTGAGYGLDYLKNKIWPDAAEQAPQQQTQQQAQQRQRPRFRQWKPGGGFTYSAQGLGQGIRGLPRSGPMRRGGLTDLPGQFSPAFMNRAKQIGVEGAFRRNEARNLNRFLSQ